MIGKAQNNQNVDSYFTKNINLKDKIEQMKIWIPGNFTFVEGQCFKRIVQQE